jgi:hypothetical protein
MQINSIIADLDACAAFVRGRMEDLAGISSLIWSWVIWPIRMLIGLISEELDLIRGMVSWLNTQLGRFRLLIGIENDMRRPGIYQLCRDYDQLPELDLNGRMGATGYIDCVTAEMMRAPVMRGRDQYGRPFLAIKARVDGLDGVDEVVGTFFHRYSDGTDLAFGTCYSHSIIFNDARVRSEQEADYLSERIHLLRQGTRVQSLDVFDANWAPDTLVRGNGDITLWCE